MVPKTENGQGANRRLTRYMMLALLFHIAPLIDIPMFNTKYLATHKVQAHASAISKLMCSLCACTGLGSCVIFQNTSTTHKITLT